ncbi:MAG: hypothetical protein K2N88_02585 [Muribaculaceae bacterium]|nr:hypothetical protein [Muribaculaceae bacterium]
MSNEITLSNNAPNLPAEVSTEIRLLMTWPAKYLENLPAEKMDAERPPNAIMLSHYKRSLDRGQQLMYLSLMITEVNDFFNVRGNMNAKQIKLTAELILDNPGFYDLTLGNIKACFRQKMATAKLYDRLDGNIIIDWLREFKSEMAENVYDHRMGERESSDKSSDAISHKVYMAMLEARSNDGDKEAQEILNEYKKRSRILSEEEQRKKELEFFKYKQEYAKRKQELHPDSSDS